MGRIKYKINLPSVWLVYLCLNFASAQEETVQPVYYISSHDHISQIGE